MIAQLTIPRVGAVPVGLPASIAARLDVLTVFADPSANRHRLLWAVLGLCWDHPDRRWQLPAYRPERGDRDLYAYAAKVMEHAVGTWRLSPYQDITATDADGNEVVLKTTAGEVVPLTLSSIGLVLRQKIEESIPRPEVIDDGANFTSQREAG